MNFFILSIIKAAVVAFVLLTTLAYLQCGWNARSLRTFRCGWGPRAWVRMACCSRFADVIKLITKEDLLPPYVNKFIYLLAPFLAVTMALISISVIPFGSEIQVFGQRTWMQLTDLNIGLLFILAISSMGVYGVALAGWASNNKYALLGGLRSSAQMISYELPLSLAIAAPLLLSNSLSLRQIVETQTGSILHWNILRLPAPQIVSFIVFLIAGFAETNRVPFDLPEAENELVAGFHTEYSSMKFAAFFMAEYANMVTMSCLTATLFLGGWQPLFSTAWGSNLVPTLVFAAAGLVMIYHGLHPARKRDRLTLPAFGIIFLVIATLFLLPPLQQALIPLFWFLAKVGAILFLFIWIRGTLPRFRYDQLMGFAWKVLFPIALLNLLVTGLLVALS